ncbi:MAG: hypothetical protein COT18_04145, partial [Elusimicrobia bacterium CG08_land_8_20_14_0_20_59_10]
MRYFSVDKTAPTLSITAPAVTVPNNIGQSSILETLGGEAADLGFGVDRVEYSLHFNKDDPTGHWQHYVDSGVWTTDVGDIWNTACDSAVGCSGSGATWAIWKSSNIAWFESETYVFTARAVDEAGNISSEKTISFIYDTSAPETRVTTSGGAMTTRLTGLAGTAQDRSYASTCTASGLDGNIYLAVARKSDGSFWDSQVSTWTGGVSVSTIVSSPGTGIKNWSLALPSTFYDLLPGTTDTFYVYTWAKDRVSNPDAAYANKESSETPKLTFSYQSSSPTLVSGSFYPEAGSAKREVTISSVAFTLDPVGGRIKQVWAAFLKEGNYNWTGSSWSDVAVTDNPSAFPAGVWLSTAADPAMIFAAPAGQSILPITFSGYGGGISSPTWSDGGKYRIYMKAENTAGQKLLYYPPNIVS